MEVFTEELKNQINLFDKKYPNIILATFSCQPMNDITRKQVKDIMTAVNNHSALVDALEGIMDYKGTLIELMQGNFDNTTQFEAAIEKAKAALQNTK